MAYDRRDHSMAYVKIKFGRALWVTDSDTLGMASIGYCLTDDIGFDVTDRIEWILKNSSTHISNNRTFIAKRGNTIIIDDLYSDDEQTAMIMPISTAIDLLQQWDAICKTYPAEVTIYYEDDRFTIEPVPRPREGH